MVRRVLLGDDGDGNMVFRVSRPGFDVMGASGGQLAFDSQFLNAVKVHMAFTRDNTTLRDWVYFGKTFNQPPPVIVTFKQFAHGANIPDLDYEFHQGLVIVPDQRSAYSGDKGGANVLVQTNRMNVGRDTSVLVLDVEQ